MSKLLLVLNRDFPSLFDFGEDQSEYLAFIEWYAYTGKPLFEEFCENERPGRNNQDVG